MPSDIRSWNDFEDYFDRLAGHGIVNSIKDFYWDVRPKPEYGTVELRVLDTPLHPAYAAALASYARELCIEVCERPGALAVRRCAANCMPGTASTRPRMASRRTGSIP